MIFCVRGRGRMFSITTETGGGITGNLSFQPQLAGTPSWTVEKSSADSAIQEGVGFGSAINIVFFVKKSATSSGAALKIATNNWI